MLVSSKPKLYIHVGQATHFLRWEVPEFEKYFQIVDRPSKDVALLVFGPDVLEEAARIPALKRFAVLFPGFGHNPLYNVDHQTLHKKLISKYYTAVFINNGPLEIAYKGLDNVMFYPFSVDSDVLKFKGYKKALDSLVHISSDYPQKDWLRSQKIMELTGLKYEVYPPRNREFFDKENKKIEMKNRLRGVLSLTKRDMPPSGYLSHGAIINKYYQYDGFVHVARDIKDPVFIDGKYTATLIEAGIVGCILFWHDTFGLGNNLETVFNLPLDEQKAADEIVQIRKNVDIKKHSMLTRTEMLDTFNPQYSVSVRARAIIDLLN